MPDGDGVTPWNIRCTFAAIDRGALRTLFVSILLVTSVSLVPISGTATQITTGAGPAGQEDGGAPEHLEFGSNATTHQIPPDGNRTLPANGTDVTLITGQTVTIVERGNETLYRTNASARMERVTTPRGTYVYPRNVDVSKFDRDLFNVDLLREQNLTDAETSSIPVIVERRSQGGGPGANGAQRGPPPQVLDEVPGGEHRQTLASIGSTAGRMGKAQAGDASRRLASDDDVQEVHLDAKMELALEDADADVDATNARQTYGVTGEGVTVAVIDSGVDNDHPDIQGSVVLEKNFNTDADGGTDDDNGHGTHVAGIITGDGTASDGKYVGIAPDASIIDARVFPESGGASTSEIISAMEYSVDNGADVLSLSLGGPTYRLRDNDPYHDAVTYAVDRDVSVVVAAGNSGPDYETVLRPGIMGDVITVGASDDAGGVASFSSRGPTPYGGYVKPDVVAPGVSVTSTQADTTGYTSKSGTSMAAPMVSGTVALLRQQHPTWSEQRIKNVVTATSDSLGPQSVYAQGGGRVNATAALGTDLAVDAATTDFGKIDAGRHQSSVLRVHNLGDETRTVDVSARAEAVASNDLADVTLNRTTVTVDPGSSAALELRIDPSGSSYGPYSGRLSFDDTHTAIFGFDSSATVRVEKTAIDGNTSGDRVTLVNHDTGRQYGPFDLGGGVREVTVEEGGTYTAVSAGVTDGDSQPVVTANTTTVSGTTTIRLDESETVERGIDASLIPQGDRDLANLTVAAGATVAGANTGIETRVADVPTAAVRVSPNAKANYTIYRVLAAAPGEEVFDTSAVYHLEHEATNVTGPGDYAIDTAQLGELHARYYRDAPGESYGATVGSYVPEQPSDVVTSGGLGTTHRQTIYASPGLQQYQKVTDGGGWTAVDQQGIVDVTASTDRSVTVGRHPFQAAIREWNLTADSLSWAVSPRVGQGPNPYAMADGSDGSVTLWIDGERQFTDDGALDHTEQGDTSIQSIGSARLRIEDGNERSFLSNRTVTTIAAGTSGEDTTPPAVPRVTFANQSATNLVPNGTVTMNVSAGDDVGVDDVTAYVSEGDVRTTPFEDGTGWREVELTKLADGTYTVSLDEHGYRGPLSVAVNASDAAGNYVETTAIDAVVVGSRAPVASATADRSTAEINVTDVAFDASETTDDAAIATYAWDFDGDGAVDAETADPTTMHTYDAFGQFRPEVTVTDVHGFANATSLAPVTVGDTTPPVARVGADDRSPAVGDSVSFDASASSDNNAVASYEWNADGSATLTANGPAMTATFESAGERRVRVTATDANGTTDTATTTVYVGNEAPTAVADDATVDGGTDVTLDASGSSDPEGHALRYEWAQVGGPTATLTSAISASASFTAPNVDAERTVEFDVTVTDEFGRSDVERVSVTVQPADDGGNVDDGGGGGSGGSGGGGFSGGGGGSFGGGDIGTEVAPPSPGDQAIPEVELTGLDGSSRGSSVTVRNASGGQPVSVELPAGGAERFTALEITPGADGDFEFDVSERENAPEGTADLNASTGHRPIGFATIDHGPVDLSSVAYTFTVSRERLAEIGAEPDGVALFRYEDGAWVAKDTALQSESGGTLTYTGTSDGFSTYAIGAAPSAGGVTVTDASVDRTAVGPGEELTVTATVENEGSADATRSLDLSVDGAVVATENLSVAAGKSRTLAFTHVFDAAGEYAVSVGGASAGTVTVSPERTGTEISPTPDRTDAPDGDAYPQSRDTEQRTTVRNVAAEVPVAPIAVAGAALAGLLALVLVRRN